MYCMIVSHGVIVDACASPDFVRWQEKNGIWLSCDKADAHGVVASNGNDIYLLEGISPMAGYEYASVTEITEEEFANIHDELSAGTVPETDRGEDVTEPTLPKSRLQMLEEEVAALMETNSMLTECILEMSEIIYGD